MESSLLGSGVEGRLLTQSNASARVIALALPDRSSKRQRCVMLAPVVINAVDDALDAVPAQAPVVMARQPEAHTDLDHEVAKRVELGRQARVSESPPAQGILADHVVSRPSGERPLNNVIVDACEIVAMRSHAGHRTIGPAAVPL
jgi:hypothetical protein